jgi:hydroxymethylglutaryl-CoA reductase
MIGQIQIIPKENVDISSVLSKHKQELLDQINQHHPHLTSFGGGAQDFTLRTIQTSRGDMIILDLYVDVKDAMGANIVNTMVENLGKGIKKLKDYDIRARILSNLSDKRIALCNATFDRDLLGGDDIVNNILDITAFAETDPYRAVTHNKGIMNGISAISLATGNDTRAIEASAHAYASIDGKYKPLSTFWKEPDGNLSGRLSIPLSLGIIGGITNIHPMSLIALKILGVSSASELIQVAGAVGLAQNIAALRALADEGIQQSHMRLHKRKML